MAIGLTLLQNKCIDTLGPKLAKDVSKSLKAQISGRKEMAQIETAIYHKSLGSIAKTQGAQQNIGIAQQFVSTAFTALEAVEEQLIGASKAVMTLLNGTVSSDNKNAAAEAIANVLGRAHAENRGQQEGSVIQALRNAGTGQSPFYTVTTEAGAAPTPDAPPPAAGSASGLFYYPAQNGAPIPPNTFADPKTSPITFTGLSKDDIAAFKGQAITVEDPDVDGTTKTVASLKLTIGDAHFASEMVNFASAARGETQVNLYRQDDPADSSTWDKSQYITLTLAGAAGTAGPAGLDDSTAGTIKTAVEALFSGTFNDTPPPPLGVFNYQQGAAAPAANTFVTPDPNDPATMPTVLNVAPGEMKVQSVTYAGAAKGAHIFVAQVGDAIYSTDGVTEYDFTTGTGSSAITLYLNGDSSSGSSITLPLDDCGSGITDNTTAYTAFEAIMTGTIEAGPAASVGGSFHFNTGSNVGAGYFTATLKEGHLLIKDQFGATINSFPMSSEELKEHKGQTIQVGDIGFLTVPTDYSGGALNFDLKVTASKGFDAQVTVAATGGTRNIHIPNLTDQVEMFGAHTGIDIFKLGTDNTYQNEVKGMIDHALRIVEEKLLYLTNVSALLDSDEVNANATLESLENLRQTVSEADELKTAQRVFESAQRQKNMVEALTIVAALKANIAAASSQIAQLAVRG